MTMRSSSYLAALSAVFIILAPAPASLATVPQPVINASGAERRLPDVLQEVTPAVVHIAVTSSSSAETNPLYNDPFFRRYFNLPEEQPRLSAGSGVIVDAEKGFALTNHQVAADASEITVTLKDREGHTALTASANRRSTISLTEI